MGCSLAVNGVRPPPVRTLDVYDPATGEVIKTIADAGVEDGAAAMDAAVDAAAAWAKTPPRERAEILRRAFDLVRSARTRSRC